MFQGNMNKWNCNSNSVIILFYSWNFDLRANFPTKHNAQNSSVQIPKLDVLLQKILYIVM